MDPIRIDPDIEAILAEAGRSASAKELDEAFIEASLTTGTLLVLHRNHQLPEMVAMAITEALETVLNVKMSDERRQEFLIELMQLVDHAYLWVSGVVLEADAPVIRAVAEILLGKGIQVTTK